MSKDDPLYGIKENMIKSLGMTVEQEFRLMANGNGTVPANMLRSLRIQLMRFKEVDRFGASKEEQACFSVQRSAGVQDHFVGL